MVARCGGPMLKRGAGEREEQQPLKDAVVRAVAVAVVYRQKVKPR